MTGSPFPDMLPAGPETSLRPECGVQGEGERHGRVGGIFDHILGDEAAVLNVVADADHEGEREYLALIFKVQADAGGRLLRHLKALEIQGCHADWRSESCR